MKHEEFVDLVDRMLSEQRRYFNARRANLPEAALQLKRCKEIERDVVSEISRFKRQQAMKDQATMF